MESESVPTTCQEFEDGGGGAAQWVEAEEDCGGVVRWSRLILVFFFFESGVLMFCRIDNDARLTCFFVFCQCFWVVLGGAW